MLSIRKLMSVVKDVDLEAMPSSIFVNDDDDDDDDDDDISEQGNNVRVPVIVVLVTYLLTYLLSAETSFRNITVFRKQQHWLL